MNSILFKLSLALSCLLLFSCKSNDLRIVDMRCEYMKSPINIDSYHPRFSWVYDNNKKYNNKQLSYKLDIATSKEALDKGDLLWSSNKVLGPSTMITYTGDKEFLPHTKYYWQVTSWDEADRKTISSLDSFETAKFSNDDWKGSWISDKYDKSFGPSPMFRKSINIKGEITSAKIFISAVAYYKLFVNGVVPNTEKLDPGYTHYDKRNLYTTIDVTDNLSEGENIIAMVLGNGFYNADKPVATWDFEKARWRNRASVIMELRIKLRDGTELIIPTDETWKTNTGPYLFNNIYGGDYYDARAELVGWNEKGYDDSGWSNAILATPPSNKLVSQTMDPIRVTKEIPAISMQSFGDTVYVFDMGVNLTGVPKINVRGNRGTKITLTHGELLKENGRIEMRNLDIYYKPIEGIEFQTDTYILKGDTMETYAPDFTYHGFRYVEVKSDKPVKLKKEDLTALFMHTDLQSVGSFECSNVLLNKIWSATMQSYLGNLHSIPTDCPQREKNGWTADGHIAIDLGLLNYDGIKFYEKWLDDFLDNQRPEGNISGIIPSAGWGYDDWIGPVWDAAMFIIPDALEKYYGDIHAIEKMYPACEKYLSYLKNRENEEGTVTYGIGDWVFYKTQTPTDYTTTCFYYWDNILMARFSDLLGKDGTSYKLKAESLRTLINKKYFDKESKLYANGSQTAQAVALALDIVPKEYESLVAKGLNDLIVKNNYHLDFGVLGSKYVPRMLSKYGYAETAYKMATQESAPSWGNWIKLGFTTLAETWALSPEFRDASVNHVFLGDISAWMTNTLAGINYDTMQPGFNHVIIKPDYIEDLKWVKGSYKSVKGLIKSEWERVGDKIKLTVTIPYNTTATVYTDKKNTVGGGQHVFTF